MTFFAQLTKYKAGRLNHLWLNDADCFLRAVYDSCKIKSERNELMKSKIIAAVMAAVMTVSSMCVPVYARYTPENSTYDYHDTEGLEATIDEGNNNAVVLTWPAVDTEGNLLNQNPLRADGQVESNGNPTAGYTNPTNGMIIEFDGWLPDGTHNRITHDNKTTHNVLMGLVDTPTDYQVVVKDPRLDTTTSAQAVKIGYIDTTVVSKSFATAYQIQYSKDGQNWTLDHIAATVDHGKKLTRIQTTTNESTGEVTETLADDKKNTFFLESQITEAMQSSLEAGATYYVRVNAYDASTPASVYTPYKTFETTVTVPAEAEKTPAFNTVEGGGKYSQGGRGGDVYVVTNLTDSVSAPQPGSLRYGLERRDLTNKTAPRTIVFAVGGTINIDPAAAKSERRFNVGSNTTILGQTAPGEGITVAGASMKFNGENIIVRYMRFRLGGGYDLDAATATGKYIVIDHCSFGWGVDEVFSAKEVVNSSIQYNIISSGLAMPYKNAANNSDPEILSGESEAKHGMGSILNGYETSYTHNLWAHCGTRNPRFEGGFSYNNVRYENKIDFANNVVYDWGHNSTYGGDRGNGIVNFVGNYYKPGPETLAKVKTQFVDCDSANGYRCSYYIDGNKMTSSDTVTADNTLGFTELSSAAAQLTTPVDMKETYTATSADDAYLSVLKGVGASHYRDPQDNRLIAEVDSGKGAFINDQAEAGGFDSKEFAQTKTDSDNDGIPDDAEQALGLNANDASDSCRICEADSPYNGYSYIEVYAGSIVGDWDNSESSQIIINSAEISDIVDVDTNASVLAAAGNTVLESGKMYTASISSAGLPLQYEKCTLYLNDTASEGNTLTAPDEAGVYNLSALVENGGTRVYSFAVPVTVIKGSGNLDGFKSTDIGSVPAVGVDSYDAATGTLYTQGSGKLGTTKTTSTKDPDACHFNYKLVRGDFDFIAKADNLAKIDYLQKSGLMARASLDPESECYMTAVTYIKGEDYDGQTDITGQSVKAKNIASFYRTVAGKGISLSKFMGVPVVRQGETPNTGYARLTRVGKKVTMSASLDKETWYTLREFEDTTLPDVCYVGFATAAAQDTSDKVRSNVTAFSDISLDAAEVTKLYGDVNCDGIVTAGDAALALQYVLTKDNTLVTEQGLENAMVIDATTLTAQNAAQILQKSLDGSYKFPAEQTEEDNVALTK